MSYGYYILDENGEPVECDDRAQWGREYRKERHLGDDMVGEIRVSTVFLGLDHGWDGGPPVLWETMVFGGQSDMYQERYTSRADALAGHARILEAVKSGEIL